MEFIETITLRQVFDFIVGAIAVLSVLIEFSKKIPFHPWSFLFTYIGNSLNKGLQSKLDEIERRQDNITETVSDIKSEMKDKFDELAKEADTKEAKRLRSRIIDFADSCRVHQKHTKTAFENIFRDYSDYCDYCKAHDIPNHFIDAEFEFIKDVYVECQEENKFL